MERHAPSHIFLCFRRPAAVSVYSVFSVVLCDRLYDRILDCRTIQFSYRYCRIRPLQYSTKEINIFIDTHQNIIKKRNMKTVSSVRPSKSLRLQAVLLFLSFMMMASTRTTLAFSPTMTKSSSSQRASSSYLSRLYMSSEANEKEIKEMESLIISLSLEPTDDSRRERVATLFAEELAKPNGFPKKFTDTFGAALETVGSQVQAIAMERALEKEKNEKKQTNNNDDASSSGEEEKIGTAPEDRQLWALIDMMVQSKTLVKRATGDLGSKGTFS